jgi:alginate O-acetyltransferase complex protein AlgI
MVFTSVTFVLFLSAVLIALATARNRDQRQAVLLVASIFFYGYWRWSYLVLLAIPTVIDYVCAICIEDSSSQRRKRSWVAVSVVSNLGLLAYFKYANFFLRSISAVTGTRLSIEVILPIGISFYTFKTLSYTIDVYRKEIPACRSFWRYAMFVTYFPELIAGPIVRASIFLPQMKRTLTPSWSRAVVGMQIVLLGVTKKVLIADRLSTFVDAVFADPAAYTSGTVLLAVLAYTIQIYCDFSGYSDIAIGISRIIGFDLPENFNMPYLSRSVTEFWRRWHITLSQWLRDYLYIPLGGSRRGKVRTFANLFLTMLLGGLWHGANWTFVFWGALHGGALVVHKLWLEGRTGGSRSNFWNRAATWAITFAFVCTTWVFFRAPTFAIAWAILRKACWLDSGGQSWMFTPLFVILPFVVLAHAVGSVAARFQSGDDLGFGRGILMWLRREFSRSSDAAPVSVVKPHAAGGIYVVLALRTVAGLSVVLVWAGIVFLFAPVQTNPFIYFQF